MRGRGKGAFGFGWGFKVFWCGREGLVAEPRLHGANIDASPQPSRSSGVPEAVQVPMVGIQFGPLGNGFAPVMKKTIIRLAVRGGENKRTTIHVGVLLRPFSYLPIQH